MSPHSIPVDIRNPGEVFACLGFMELAGVLGSRVRGWFEWGGEKEPRFSISWSNHVNPFDAALSFLVNAEIIGINNPDEERTFPMAKPDAYAYPLLLVHNEKRLLLTSWADGSDRLKVKFFAGSQNGLQIFSTLRDFTGELYQNHRTELLSNPFGLVMPMPGRSFKMDARKAWNALNIGFSLKPHEKKIYVASSPLVELLAMIGLENARPSQDRVDSHKIHYSIWGAPLPLILARPALAGALPLRKKRNFSASLEKSGQNTVVTFAIEEEEE